MGKPAALCAGRTRGLVSLLGAVPCLACHELPAMSTEPGGRGGGGGGGGGGPAGGAPAAPPGSDTYKGWLFKWTNYLKGYQRRWFVLSNGLLSYYRSSATVRSRGSSWKRVKNTLVPVRKMGSPGADGGEEKPCHVCGLSWSLGVCCVCSDSSTSMAP